MEFLQGGLAKVISAFTVIISVLFSPFTILSDALLYPEYEMTDSIEFAQSLGKGWNLGNTFDACEKQSTEKARLETETMWGNPKTTKELLAYVKECGFDSIRLPVTWAQHMGDAPDYTIDSLWLERVAEVVDWILELDMKVVLNTHHEDAFWLIADDEHKEKSAEILCKLWLQICDRFASYSEKLVFETMNEPRVFGAELEWEGTDERREVVNYLNFAALETIRNSGGNNAERYVMIPTFAASGLDENIDALRLPEDDRVIVSIHYYYMTAHQNEFSDNEKVWNLSEKRSLYKTFKHISQQYLLKGYGVCESEFGWTDREHLDNLAKNARFYVELAEKFGFSVMVWDNGIAEGKYSFGLIDRNNLTQYYPSYVEAIVN